MLGNLKGLWDSNTKKRCRNNASSVSNSNSIAESSSYARFNMPQTPALVNDLQAEDVPAAENRNEVRVLISLGY